MTRRKVYGPMDIDYRHRCVVPNGNFDRIYYGHTAAEYTGPSARSARDITDTFKDKVGSVRRTAVSGVHEENIANHFFTKDLKRDEVIDALCRGSVSGRAGSGRLDARRSGGGKPRVEEDATARRGLRNGTGSPAATGTSSTYDFTEETCPCHVASPDDPKVCDRCGTHIDSLRPDEEFDYE